MPDGLIRTSLKSMIQISLLTVLNKVLDPVKRSLLTHRCWFLLLGRIDRKGGAILDLGRILIRIRVGRPFLRFLVE